MVDGTVLIDWLKHFPVVARWRATKMNLPAEHIETWEEHWNSLRTIDEPPPLIPESFLANRIELRWRAIHKLPSYPLQVSNAGSPANGVENRLLRNVVPADLPVGEPRSAMCLILHP